MINETRRLSVGGTPGLRIFAAAFGLVFAAIGATFVILPIVAEGLLRRMAGAESECIVVGDVSEFPAEVVQDCVTGDSPWGFGPLSLIGLCGIPFVLMGLYAALRALRSAIWLDGTQARVRGAFGTRTVDLATAEITAGATTVRRERSVGHDQIFRLPTLIARDPGTGRQVTVPLHGAGMAQLPPHELRALADAMTRGRPTVGHDADVHTIARQLRAMADNPLGL